MSNENRGVIVFIITIVIIIILSSVFGILFYINKKDDKKLIELNNYDKEQSLTIDGTIYSLMNLAIGGYYEEGFSNALNDKKNYDLDNNFNINVNNFDDNTISLLVYNYAKNNNILKIRDSKNYTLSKKKFDEITSKIFGNFRNKKIIEGNTSCPSISYDFNKKIYNFKLECGINTNISRYSKIIDVKENNDKIIVTEETCYYSTEKEKDNVFAKYNDAINNINSIGTIIESTDVQVNNLKEDLARYKYIFKKDNDDKYYFYEINRIN